MLQTVARRGVAAATAAAASAAMASTTESRAAPPTASEVMVRGVPTIEEVVSGEAMYAQQDAIISAQHIVGSLGTSLIEESGFDVVSYDDLLESIINTAAVAAQDPAVQRAVQRVLERHGDASQTLKFMEQRASLRASPAGPVPIHGPQSPGESWTLAQPPPSEVHSLSSSMSATVSDLMEADAVINKSFLDRHAVPLQKAARGWLARKRRHAAEVPTPAEGVLLSQYESKPRKKLAPRARVRLPHHCNLTVVLPPRLRQPTSRASRDPPPPPHGGDSGRFLAATRDGRRDGHCARRPRPAHHLGPAVTAAP